MKSFLRKNLLLLGMLGILLATLFVFFIPQSTQAAVIACGQPIVPSSGDTCAQGCQIVTFGGASACITPSQPLGNRIIGGVVDAAKCVGNPLACIVDGIADVIAMVVSAVVWLLGLFFSIAATFTQLMLNLNYQVTQNPLVTYGWSIVRDFANLGFVLVLLIIAFATILRFESYGMKQLLWKLVIAAVLVNFSLFFANMFIDFTNYLASQFYDGSKDGFVNAISGALGADKALDVSQIPQGKIPGAAEAFITVAINGVAAIFYMLLGIVIMFTIGFMLLVRYVHLIFLLIIAPLAWLFWTFPDLSGHSRSWWSSFLRWCFFAPASLFFLFISVQMAAWLLATNKINGILGGSLAGQAAGSLSMIGQIVQAFANIFIVGAMMVGSLIIGDKFGVTGAQMGIKYAKKVSVGALGAVGMKGARAGRRLLDRPTRALERGAAAASGAVPTGKKATLLTLGLNRLAGAGLRGAAVGLGKVAGSGKEAQKKEAEEYKKGLTGMSRPALQALALTGNPAQIAAIASAKAEKGLLSHEQMMRKENPKDPNSREIPTDLAIHLLRNMEKVDMEDALLTKHPDLIPSATKYKPSAAEVGQGITAEEKFVGKLRASDIDKWDEETLNALGKNERLLQAIAAKNRGLLSPIAERLNQEQMTKIKNTFSAAVTMGIAEGASKSTKKMGDDARTALAFMAKNDAWAAAFPEEKKSAANTGSRPAAPSLPNENPQPSSPNGPSELRNKDLEDYDQG